MSIGTTIKKLRRERDITQEQLADMLGLTACAVSQWECGRTAPDISQIPILANIFEVSADILLEIDIVKSKRAEEIAAFAQECLSLQNKGKHEERLALCRKMYKKYPNDETVMEHLMRALKAIGEKEDAPQIIDLGERLLSSDDFKKRHSAIRCLCFTHEEIGNHAEALKYAGMIPANEDLFIHILRGKDLLTHCQAYFGNLCHQMFVYSNSMVYCTDAYSHEECHAICKKLYDIFHLLHENADFSYKDEDCLGRLCFRMAQDSAMSGHPERALDELEEMLEHFDKMTAFTRMDHTSLLINRFKTEESNILRLDEEPIHSRFVIYLERRSKCFESIADHPRFLAVKETLLAKSAK